MGKHRNSTVLVVDDEPDVRLVAATALEDAGYDVVEARSADHALEILTSRADVGVLFTDVNMPGQLNGMTLAKLVHERWPAIQLVITSGRPLTERVPDEGRFMKKPYTLAEMQSVIADASETQG